MDAIEYDRCIEALEKRIAELEGRMLLAMRVNYADYSGYVAHALRGDTVPAKVMASVKKICRAEKYTPTLGGDDE